MLKTFDFDKMPIVEIVNDILVDSAKRGASDIHFDPQEEAMKVRIRIDGALTDYAEIPNTVKKNLTTRIKIISGMNITESRLPQDGAIKATLQDLDLDLRVSVLPISNGEKIVIRILDYKKSLNGLESLGFSDDNLKKVLYMIGVPNGIILVTGATGSGKSTTVYSILQRLNKEDTNLITVEDPIEMDIGGVNQVQVNSEIGLTFATALRSILRQDPNIIMIGEIRDTETAKIAVRASITGHLVLSTIHTNNSLNTIERLLDMDVERYLLSSALTGIISQKLARNLCPKCRKLRPTNEYEKKLFRKVLGKDVNEIYSAVGCEECGNGYSGRIAIHEVLVINQEIRDALSSGLSKEKLRELVYKSDVNTLLQDGLEKVIKGDSTVEEILKLIELENDDKLAGELDLKKALEFTAIANENENTSPNVNPVGTEQNLNQMLNLSSTATQNNMQQATAVPNINPNPVPVTPVINQTPTTPVINPVPPISSTEPVNPTGNM
ncbi:MAG TPA: GspE/PulE family protein [Bacilli bacterium]|nr:GspE/PulE family protein [Bacilli bacterium]